MEIGYSENEKETAKFFITQILPLTIVGLLLWIMGRFFFGGKVEVEFIASTLILGCKIWMLAAWYYLGKGALLLTNKIISRFTSEKRIPEEN